MLEKVFWNYFKSTGNVDAYLAAKDFDNDDKDSKHSINTSSNLINNIELEGNDISHNSELNI